MSSQKMSDKDVWKEIADAAEELYQEYLDMQELNAQEPPPAPSAPLDMERNWNVPVGVEVNT
ncbi:MAG: hypothetical protein OXN84_16185 [Albidovulum sp.]|nr:hypothetical protein [Albidovulum sp.]